MAPDQDLRLAAGLLAVGGLLLLARAASRRLAVVLTALGWAATDLALDSVPGPRRVVAAVVLAAVLIRWSVPVGLSAGVVVALAVGLVYELVREEFRLMMLLQIERLGTVYTVLMALGVATLVESVMIAAALGLLALLPRPLSTPERTPAVDPVPEPASPADPGCRAASTGA